MSKDSSLSVIHVSPSQTIFILVEFCSVCSALGKYILKRVIPPPIKITTQVVCWILCCLLCAGEIYFKEWSPPIPNFSIKTTTQVVCSILSCLLWTVEQYLSCVLTRDSYTETPPQKLNVNVLHSVLLYLPCARTPDRCRDPGSLCWHWLSLCTGSCKKSSMIRYGSVSLPCTEEEKTKIHFNYIHHMS